MTRGQPSEAAARVNCRHHGLTCLTRDGVLWTRVNTGELMPGVMTPMAWSYYAYGVELGLRRGFHYLGMINADEALFPLSPDERIVASFHGRLSGNVNVARRIFSTLPGVSGDDIERDLLGSVRADVIDLPHPSRLPALMIRVPRALLTVGRQAHAHQQRIRAWWRDVVDGDRLRRGHDPAQTIASALDEFVATLRLQICMRVFGQAVSAQLAAVADRVGQPHALGTLLGGAAATEESRVADDLYSLAGESLSIEAFLAEHGYQGPNSGDPSARVWREDPRPIERLLGALADAEPPTERRARAVAERNRLVAKIIADVPLRHRPLTELAIRMAPIAARSIEVTKTSMLLSVDVGRAAARAIGDQIVAAGIADDIDDVFHLYCNEMAGAGDPAISPLITARKALHATFLSEELPETWQGNPIVSAGQQVPIADVTTLRGLGVSPGVVRGRVRIVRDSADEISVNEGDILVCPTTDPSWVSLMTLAAALVIDIGAAASHGAIVARELGVPCVTGTRSGTRQLRDGDIVEVDGCTGIVEVLERPSGVTGRA